ncbi:hypothetical protein [Xenorhabdus bovienii]|uniref:hypothetical protein n=1 Tax=Xenorhabdus bovienii TaxID=40576 RepID=UPI0023B2BE53|nr:hypothetical protein [Xenorhabdus bovienii]MDE9443740.1 hypothetical protein [Xenorhabdus bovienii]MDE9463547.1 hypothetical protein [Xenorhabdus bovienii]MDE9471262.1 hypothetical protein [Xenorhabdus bovienii]
MLKKIAAVLLFLSGVAGAAPNELGVYRDKNFNILATDGRYSCNIYPYSERTKDKTLDSLPVIGKSTLAIESDKHSDSKRMFVNFHNGTKIVTPFMLNLRKGSTENVYAMMTRDDIYILAIDEPVGVVAIIKREGKGDETSVTVAKCTLQN